MIASPAMGQRIRGTIVAVFLRAALGVYHFALRLASRRPTRPKTLPLTVLLTGKFLSANWLLAHARPIAASKAIREVVVVGSEPLFAADKIRWVVPSPIARRLLGSTLSRLFAFAAYAVRHRPDYIGGFHLLFNGLLSILLAKAAGVRSIYISVGGRTEMENGASRTENRLFRYLGRPNLKIEKQLLTAAGSADLVVTMGNGAASLVRERAHARHVMVHPGSVPVLAPTPAAEKDIDLLFVGRFARVKRLDLFVAVVALVARAHPSVRVVLVGDGPLRGAVESDLRERRLDASVRLAGFQPDVRPWLRRSKLFMLTSESEGLSLAVMEAMAAGLTVVVPDVGDLGDLVHDGVNGYLVSSRDPEEFAARVNAVLSSEKLLASLSAAAHDSAKGYELAEAAKKWDSALS